MISNSQCPLLQQASKKTGNSISLWRLPLNLQSPPQEIIFNDIDTSTWKKMGNNFERVLLSSPVCLIYRKLTILKKYRCVFEELQWYEVSHGGIQFFSNFGLKPQTTLVTSTVCLIHRELTKLQKVDYRSVQMKNFWAREVSHGRVRFCLSFGRNLKIIIFTSSICLIHRELPTLQKAEHRCVQMRVVMEYNSAQIVIEA